MTFCQTFIIIELVADKKRGDCVSPRIGRPKSDNPKDTRITIRLDKEDCKILELYCEQEQVDKAKAIRTGIKKLEADLKK